MATVADSGKSVTRLGSTRIEEKRHSESLFRMSLRRFLKHRMAVAGVFLLMGVFVFVVGGSIVYSESYSNTVSMVDKFKPPSAAHPFGTDQVGRDVLARTVYGGQISLMIAVSAVTISITLGTIVGLISGYTVGTSYSWIDSVLMRIVEALLAFPSLFLLLTLSQVFAKNPAILNANLTVFGRELNATVIAIVLVIGLLGWMGLSRIVRSLVLTLKEQEFVTSARALGAGNARIIFAHILPNCIAPIVVTATLGIGGAIITEAYLSFLGFGVQPPTATWGNILERARDSISAYWWLAFFPGMLITITVLAINFIGDGLRDALDPRSKN
ncbi:MAG TPA: ABC transporter permease [Phototrophicaceae bacterium]|jgi:peptide/nickel transport system permease protein|nr:ABC transporter permease [Phototrophicaceae bacterium]